MLLVSMLDKCFLICAQTNRETDKQQNDVMYFQAVMDFFVKIQMFPYSSTVQISFYDSAMSNQFLLLLLISGIIFLFRGSTILLKAKVCGHRLFF